MANYPNMSYCMCENTLQAMQQVLDRLEEEDVDFSESEMRAFRELYYVCEDFIRLAETIEDRLQLGD